MSIFWCVFARPMHSTTKFAMTVLCKCVCMCVIVCVCLCVCTVCANVKLQDSSLWCIWILFLFLFFLGFIRTAGGAGGTDETGTNKDTHQSPVISMGTLIDVPASWDLLQWQGAKPRTPTAISFFHGCRNLSLFSTSFQTWFPWYSSDMAKG